MNLKQIINRAKILKENPIEYKMELPAEPLIYSIKYPIGKRWDHLPYFRNKQWFSMIKCHFPQQLKKGSPVVLIVTFFVTPPESARISKRAMNAEKTPAVYSYELCDYLLSFLEMVHKVLINSYRQVVRIETQKFYSSNPRTEFQFMTWGDYVKNQLNDTPEP